MLPIDAYEIRDEKKSRLWWEGSVELAGTKGLEEYNMDDMNDAGNEWS